MLLNEIREEKLHLKLRIEPNRGKRGGQSSTVTGLHFASDGALFSDLGVGM
jgi:hypothetical protein